MPTAAGLKRRLGMTAAVFIGLGSTIGAGCSPPSAPPRVLPETGW